MQCMNCGKEIPGKSTFCPYCGTSAPRSAPPVVNSSDQNNLPAPEPPVLTDYTKFSSGKQKKKKGLLICAIIIVVALLAGAAGLILWLNQPGSEEDDEEITDWAAEVFNCDLCGKESDGEKHEVEVLGDEVVYCDECYDALEDLAGIYE